MIAVLTTGEVVLIIVIILVFVLFGVLFYDSDWFD